MSLHPSSANNAASGHGGGGGDDRGDGNGKRQKPIPNDPNVGKDFDTEKKRLLALLRAALGLANMGWPPNQGDTGKMRNWVNGLRNSPPHVYLFNVVQKPSFCRKQGFGHASANQGRHKKSRGMGSRMSDLKDFDQKV